MDPFTVVMLYPESISDGVETYGDHVEADNAEQAEEFATAAFKDYLKDDGCEVDGDIRVIGIYAGHLENLV